MSISKEQLSFDFNEASKINFCIKSVPKNEHSIQRRSFCYLHETLLDIEKVYEAIESEWRAQGFKKTHNGRGFFKNKKTGIKMIKARITKMRNKGIPLTLIHTPVQDTKDYSNEQCAELVKTLKMMREHKQTSTSKRDELVRLYKEHKEHKGYSSF